MCACMSWVPVALLPYPMVMTSPALSVVCWVRGGKGEGGGAFDICSARLLQQSSLQHAVPTLDSHGLTFFCSLHWYPTMGTIPLGRACDLRRTCMLHVIFMYKYTYTYISKPIT